MESKAKTELGLNRKLAEDDTQYLIYKFQQLTAFLHSKNFS